MWRPDPPEKVEHLDVDVTGRADGDAVLWDDTAQEHVYGAAVGGALASGTGQVDDTETTAAVEHGFDGSPETVLVTPRGNELLWVPSRDGTTFTVERAGSSGDLPFDWLATEPASVEPTSSTLAYAEHLSATVTPSPPPEAPSAGSVLAYAEQLAGA